MPFSKPTRRSPAAWALLACACLAIPGCKKGGSGVHLVEGSGSVVPASAKIPASLGARTVLQGSTVAFRVESIGRNNVSGCAVLGRALIEHGDTTRLDVPLESLRCASGRGSTAVPLSGRVLRLADGKVGSKPGLEVSCDEDGANCSVDEQDVLLVLGSPVALEGLVMRVVSPG